MPRKSVVPVGSNGLTLSLMFSRGMNDPRIRQLHNVFLTLEPEDQQVIEGIVMALVHHPRFNQHPFGPVRAFELVGALGEFLAKYPKPIKEVSNDV
jgi:hypothetical protein